MDHPSVLFRGIPNIQNDDHRVWTCLSTATKKRCWYGCMSGQVVMLLLLVCWSNWLNRVSISFMYDAWSRYERVVNTDVFYVRGISVKCPWCTNCCCCCVETQLRFAELKELIARRHQITGTFLTLCVFVDKSWRSYAILEELSHQIAERYVIFGSDLSTGEILYHHRVVARVLLDVQDLVRWESLQGSVMNFHCCFSLNAITIQVYELLNVGTDNWCGWEFFVQCWHAMCR